MIDYRWVRDDMQDVPYTGVRDTADAFMDLVTNRFGYRSRTEGLVVDGDTITMVVHTPVLGRTDIITFKGSRDEMELLLRAAHCHLELLQQHGREVSQAVAAKVAEATRSTLLLVSMASLKGGEAFARGVCLTLLGQDYAAHLGRLRELSLDDLSYLVYLAQYEQTPKNQVLELVA